MVFSTFLDLVWIGFGLEGGLQAEAEDVRARFFEDRVWDAFWDGRVRRRHQSRTPVLFFWGGSP